jgi:hypothetical protein
MFFAKIEAGNYVVASGGGYGGPAAAAPHPFGAIPDFFVAETAALSVNHLTLH